MSVKLYENVFDPQAQAARIVMTCGVCKVLVISREPGALLSALWLEGLDAIGHEPEAPAHDGIFRLPFADEHFDAVVGYGGIEPFAGVALASVLEEIKRVTQRSLILLIDKSKVEEPSLTSRRGWENSCFNAGFRKHPLYYRGNDYASLEYEGEQIFIPLEKVPLEAWENYPMASLREERDLHMDMLRESGSRSDAHVERYHFAARFIRPGDAVLDAACGLGYGTYVISSETRARSFIGIDGSEYAIDYARLNFAGEATSFQQGMLPDCLASIPDNSIDHVLCFETLEHVQDPVRLLAEFQRVLTPGGRLTCSVPHDWSDETGTDPNPFHFHVYDKKRFVGELSRYFDLECLMAQTADRVKQPGGACVWLERPRSLTDIAVDQEEIEAEWLLAVAAKSPLDACLLPYSEHVFSSDEQREAGNALAFARDYSNPWLVRAMVSIGLRTKNPTLREHWAEAVSNDFSAGAADQGAALCVLAYAALARQGEGPNSGLLDRIDDYLADVTDQSNPTVLRWRVSLMYVGGLLALSDGQRDVACRFFQGVVAAPVAEYSVTLLTKPAEAAYLLGLLLAGEGRNEEAHRTWWSSFQLISTSLGKRLTQGYDVRPPLFEIREMAVALSLCGRLIAAVAHSAEQPRRPSVFYDECHTDSVTQIQSFALNLDELERGKSWLEGQWRAQAEELGSRQQRLEAQQSHIGELERGKNWLEGQWKAQQSHIGEFERGKNWLEGQWKAQQSHIGELERGKNWLEGQWKAQQSHIGELERGKNWLEGQWKAQQSHIGELESGLAYSEKQRYALDTENARLCYDLEVARDKESRLKRSLFFRVARKLGFFKYF